MQIFPNDISAIQNVSSFAQDSNSGTFTYFLQS